MTATDSSSIIRNDLQLASEGYFALQAFFDRTAGLMVYQTINKETDQVVEQYPDEAVLRRRAYFHALDLAKGSPTRAIPTDRTA